MMDSTKDFTFFIKLKYLTFEFFRLRLVVGFLFDICSALFYIHMPWEGSRSVFFVGNKAKGANLKTGASRKQSTPNFPKNEHFLPSDTPEACNFIKKETLVCVSGGKKCSFFGKFGVLCFLETPVFRFALLPYYRRSDAPNIFLNMVTLLPLPR